MFTYRKGSRVEREIMDYFVRQGFCAIRAAGSGVSSLSPDFLAFKKGRQYIFEVKAHEGMNLSVKKDQIALLKQWQEVAQMTPFVVWKRRNREPIFIPINVMKENAGSFTISLESAEMNGFKKEDLAFA
jgi:Holliday junction resolvase